MEHDRMEELIAGYAFGDLDPDEQAEAERLLSREPRARAMLAGYRDLTAGLALSVEPAPLPAGSLDRLRAKAGISAAPVQTAPRPARPVAAEPERLAPPAPPIRMDERRARRITPLTGLAYAATFALFCASMLLGWLWLDTRNNLSEAERANQALARVLSSPGLKVTELKGTDSSVNGSMRLYTDPATDRAFLVAYNLGRLPGDKEYEAWLITADNQARKAGLLGTGGGEANPLVYELQTGGQVEQYKLVAITIEKAGGVEKSEQKPVMVGSITA